LILSRWRKGIEPDVRNIVKLRDHTVPVIRTREPVFTLRLWTEVSENQHRWMILPQEDRSNQDLEPFQ
jgi:hypothetical protein